MWVWITTLNLIKLSTRIGHLQLPTLSTLLLSRAWNSKFPNIYIHHMIVYLLIIYSFRDSYLDRQNILKSIYYYLLY